MHGRVASVTGVCEQNLAGFWIVRIVYVWVVLLRQHGCRVVAPLLLLAAQVARRRRFRAIRAVLPWPGMAHFVEPHLMPFTQPQ